MWENFPKASYDEAASIRYPCISTRLGKGEELASHLSSNEGRRTGLFGRKWGRRRGEGNSLLAVKRSRRGRGWNRLHEHYGRGDEGRRWREGIGGSRERDAWACFNFYHLLEIYCSKIIIK